APHGAQRPVDRRPRLRADLVLLDEQPLRARGDGGGDERLVADDAVADRHVVVVAAHPVVLQVDERAASARALELARRVGARLPDPAQVELEEQLAGGQSAQPVEERAPLAVRLELRPVVVEAELEPRGAHRLRGAGDPRERVAAGLDPRQDEPARAERLELAAQTVELVLDRVEPRVQAGDRKPQLVEQRAHLARLAPVQAVQLDPLVAELADAPQRSLEVAGALVADRVELQADARHGRHSTDRQSAHTPLISTWWFEATKPWRRATSSTHGPSAHSSISTTRWQRSQRRW